MGGKRRWAGRSNGSTRQAKPSARQSVYGQESTTAIAFRLGSVWVADATIDDAKLIELDAKDGHGEANRPAERPTHRRWSSATEPIWVADDDAGSVSEVDLPSGQTAATIRHVWERPEWRSCSAPARCGWPITSTLTVSRINPETGAVVATIPVGSGTGVPRLLGRRALGGERSIPAPSPVSIPAGTP